MVGTGGPDSDRWLPVCHGTGYGPRVSAMSVVSGAAVASHRIRRDTRQALEGSLEEAFSVSSVTPLTDRAP